MACITARCCGDVFLGDVRNYVVDGGGDGSPRRREVTQKGNVIFEYLDRSRAGNGKSERGFD